ncbi:MAG: type II toxin-antitoxin system Phd/YefM family antitoxin [Desulfobacterales bacterium]|nr:type II toxin-antitoxin system Phd/YefM family antitoxin [Desulfobacterales bacterium]
MKTIWKYQEAERQLGKIIKNALSEGPQYVIQQEIGTVVIISVREYEHLVADKPDFVEFLLSCPKTDITFEIERQKDFSRNIEL